MSRRIADRCRSASACPAAMRREWPVVKAGELATDVLHEARLVGAGRGERERDDEVGDVVRAVLGEREQQQRQARSRVLVEPAEQAEIEEREPPVVRQQHVPEVRVGVVDALDDDLEHVGAEKLAREEGGALRVEPVPRLDPAPVDPLEDERALGHVRLDHARHDERLEPLHERSDQLRVVRLLDEVELPAEVELELVRELLELDPLRRLGVPDRETDGRAQHREIEVDLLDDSRSPHLRDDLLPRCEQAAVRLRDRGGRERLRVETDERFLAEVLAQHRLDLRERDRRDGVDEAAELLDVDVGQEIGPRREELPELDERRPELLEALAERLRSLARRVALAGHADLGKDSPQSALLCDPPDGQRAPRALETCAHDGVNATVCDLGNAGAGRACAPRSRGGRRRRSCRTGTTPRKQAGAYAKSDAMSSRYMNRDLVKSSPPSVPLEADIL